MSVLPREVAEIVNEYKEGSFRVKGKVNLLTEIEAVVEIEVVKETESATLNLREGVWSAIVSPFTYGYVYYETKYYNPVSLAKYYSLIFYLEGSDLTNLPRGITISTKEVRNKKLRRITLCSEGKILYNLNTSGNVFEVGRYSHTGYIVIMVAEITETINNVSREILGAIEEQRGKDFDETAEELLPGVDTDKHRIEEETDEKFLQKLGVQGYNIPNREGDSIILDIRLDDAPNINDGYGHSVDIDLRGTALEPFIEIIDPRKGTMEHYLQDKNNRRKYEDKIRKKAKKEPKTPKQGVLQSDIEFS